MPSYKITKVSQEPPKEWGEGERKTYYIKVMLEGHPKPVTIGKRKPDALSVGMVVEGDISHTEYAEDRFKPSSSFNKGGYRGKSPEESDNIMRMNALNNAVSLYGSKNPSEFTIPSLLDIADKLYLWLKKETQPTVGDQANEIFEGEDINLDDIGF